MERQALQFSKETLKKIDEFRDIIIERVHGNWKGLLEKYDGIFKQSIIENKKSFQSSNELKLKEK